MYFIYLSITVILDVVSYHGNKISPTTNLFSILYTYARGDSLYLALNHISRMLLSLGNNVLNTPIHVLDINPSCVPRTNMILLKCVQVNFSLGYLLDTYERSVQHFLYIFPSLYKF